ncbi:hypothetical protein L7F22_059844 [Adiantum nelumboides]|nr:hypothetical protein [Adiantum nelumboides]
MLAEGDDREVENHLVMLLDFNKKEEDWRGDESRWSCSSCYSGLHATRASAKERQKNLERSIREEARKLRDDGGEALKGERFDREGASAGGWSKGQHQMLDLDQLTFHQGGLLMINKKCELPNKTYRTTKKGYEEVHVPHLKPKPIAEGEELVRITDMPEWAQAAFLGMMKLNRVQSRVYETTLFTLENLLLCASTGAGKTNVAMITILHEIGIHMKEDGLSGFKVVYVAPMKALVAEVVGNLSKRLDSYGITIKELIGDQSLSKQQIEETQIIVTTREKWDIITRVWR